MYRRLPAFAPEAGSERRISRTQASSASVNWASQTPVQSVMCRRYRLRPSSTKEETTFSRTGPSSSISVMPYVPSPMNELSLRSAAEISRLG